MNMLRVLMYVWIIAVAVCVCSPVLVALGLLSSKLEIDSGLIATGLSLLMSHKLTAYQWAIVMDESQVN